jgi:hypothetical protein
MAKKRVPIDRNSPRSKRREWGIGFSRPSTNIGKESAKFDQPGICRRTHFFSGVWSTLDGPGARNGEGYVIAHMERQNGRAMLHAAMLFVHEAPKVSKRDGFMPQSAVLVADANFIGLQINSRDFAETLRYAGYFYQLGGCQPPPPIMARGASPRCSRKDAE